MSIDYKMIGIDTLFTLCGVVPLFALTLWIISLFTAIEIGIIVVTSIVFFFLWVIGMFALFMIQGASKYEDSVS